MPYLDAAPALLNGGIRPGGLLVYVMLRRFGFMLAPDGGGGAGGDGGSGDGGDGGAGGGDGKGDEGGAGDEGKTYTQADLDRLLTREKSQGKKAAITEVAELLGCTPEEAKAKLDAMQSAEDEKLSEVEQREKAAEAREKTATEREAAAKLNERNASVRAALIEEGIKFERDDDGKLKGRGARVLSLVLADLDADADDVAVAAAIEAVKADAPEMFTPPSDEGDDGGGSGGDGTGRPPSGDTGRKPPTQQAAESDLERGKKLAEERNARVKPFDPLAART